MKIQKNVLILVHLMVYIGIYIYIYRFKRLSFGVSSTPELFQKMNV